MELRVQVGVKKGKKILGVEDGRDVKGCKRRRVKAHGFHGLREDADGGAIIQSPLVGKES